MLTREENFYVFALLGLLILIPFLNWRHKNPLHFWSPLTMVSLIFLYYTIVGPLVSINLGITIYKLIEHRPFFVDAWRLSLIAFISILVGFNLRNPLKRTTERSITKDIRLNQKSTEQVYWKRFTVIASMCIVALVGTGGLASQIDVFNTTAGSLFANEGSTLTGYLLNGINLLIGACGLLLIANLDRKYYWILFIALVLFTIAVYTKQGFRWRHIVLGMTLLAVHHIYYIKRVNIALFMILGILTLMLMGFIGMTRSYGAGLSYEGTEEISQADLLINGLAESSVFMTTGLLVNRITDASDQIGWDPIIQTIVMPIPRQLWPGKPSGDYLAIIVSLYDEVFVNNGLGAAIFNYGEYYLMFGYTGTIIGCILLGLLFKSVWRWFLMHSTNKLAIVTYASFFSFIYMIISRGYTPQVVMLFCFTVLPLYLIFNYFYKRTSSKPLQVEHY